MARLVGYPLAGGGTAYVEVEDVAGGVVPVATAGEVATKARQSFEAALDGLRPTITTLVGGFRDLADPPDEARVEFSVGLSFDVGAFIAKGGVDANFKVTLVWERHEAKPQ